jgi:hypothetical protein
VKPVRQNTSAEKARKKYVAHAHRKSMKAPSHHQDQMYDGYGIVFTKGLLSFNESCAKPNTIVRF